MRDYEQAIEIAITGVGVVFLALASLTIVTILISRYLTADKGANTENSEASVDENDFENGLKSEEDPMLTAAMVAAIQVIEGGLSDAGEGALPSTRWSGLGIWRAHGRQLLMQSQGSPRNPRTLGK